MRLVIGGLVAALAVALMTDTAMAQRPGRPGGRPGAQRHRGPGGRGMGRRMPVSPLMRALDLDGDGELSAEEIQKAAESLKKLDKNGDGKLSRDELRPQFAGRGPRGGVDIVERLMSLDKNKDGKVTKDEFPNERMAALIERGDTNGDGALDKAEIEQMAERFRQRAGQGRGGRSGAARPR
ncbi:MAG: hypothetical protein GXP27_02010 [Planctomycetes bacterium]|nr:hypothetical protein [Planctomycetota bacterium]